jgi:hypothetical protein
LSKLGETVGQDYYCPRWSCHYTRLMTIQR